MNMITLSQCFDFTDLAPDEIVLGAVPGARHHALLASYVLNIDRGLTKVRDMIIADLRNFLDLGARRAAADHLIVLRLFLAAYPQALRKELLPPNLPAPVSRCVVGLVHQPNDRSSAVILPFQRLLPEDPGSDDKRVHGRLFAET